MLMDPPVMPLAEDEFRVINQRKSKKWSLQKQQHVGDDEEEAMV